jgi:hypothetical protein
MPTPTSRRIEASPIRSLRRIYDIHLPTTVAGAYSVGAFRPLIRTYVHMLTMQGWITIVRRVGYDDMRRETDIGRVERKRQER